MYSNGRCYRLVRKRMTWTNAAADCAKPPLRAYGRPVKSNKMVMKGGHLTFAIDDAIIADLRNLVKKVS